MSGHDLLAIPAAAAESSCLARVVAVDDPERLGRVQVRLINFDGVADQDAPLWARVAVPFAGASRGAFMLPDVDDEVLVTFVNGDPRTPVVVGGLWNGAAGPPETLPGDRVDRWTIVGKAGTRIAIEETAAGQATISLRTPNGTESVVIRQTAGGQIELSAAQNTITLDTQGVTIQTPATVKIQASLIDVTASSVTVNSPWTTFSGVVSCNTVITSNVVSSTYTPGVGNVW